MLLLIVRVRAQSAGAGVVIAKVWVDTQDFTVAQQRAQVQIQREGYEVVHISDQVETDQSDYFAPCESLNTFERAQRDGVAVLFPSSE